MASGSPDPQPQPQPQGPFDLRLSGHSPFLDPDVGKIDYFYLPPDSNAPADALVLCDSQSNHHFGPWTVLYADLHVGQLLTEADLQKAMAQPQNAAFAKALHAVEEK